MSSCDCAQPTEFRATSENAGGSFLYLRCASCGGKIGRISIDQKDMKNNLTNPAEVGEEVSIRLDPHDNPFMGFESEGGEVDDEILETYGRRRIEDASYWVYVLECPERFFYDDYDDLKRRAIKRLGEEPDWLRMAWESNIRLYVGQTENLYKRLGEHFEERKRTQFTRLFEPRRIRMLRPAHSRNRAEYLEESIGKSYYDSNDTFAYWR